MSETYLTRKTLLRRLKSENDELAWEEFVSYYQGFIHTIIHKMNIVVSERDDLSQQVLLKIWKTMPKFDYNQQKGQFRGWVHTITKNTVLTYLSHKKHLAGKRELIEQDEVTRFSEPEIDKLITEEWESHIADLAFASIEKKVSDNAMEAFLAGLRGEAIAETAARLAVNEDMVYTYKSRVKQKIIAEIKNLREFLE